MSATEVPEVEGLHEGLVGDGAPFVEPSLLRLIVQRVRRVLAHVLARLDRLEAAALEFDDRLHPIEQRLLLVDELPTSAPFGALLRLRTGTVAQRAPVYLGNGDSQPLTKLTPTLLNGNPLPG